MSIFGFLEEMFFRRTEKSELKYIIGRRCENGAILLNSILIIFCFSWKKSEQGTFLGYVMATKP
jgi:hypothetical protein